MSTRTSTLPDVRTAPRAEGLTWSGGLALCAIAAVLVVVAVPRLRALAVQENEIDARALTAMLARSLGELVPEERLPRVEELVRRPEFADLGDAEVLAGGTLLRRHGYLFEVVRLSPAAGALRAPLAMLAGTGNPLGPATGIQARPCTPRASGGRSYLAAAGGVPFERTGPTPDPAAELLVEPAPPR